MKLNKIIAVPTALLLTASLLFAMSGCTGSGGDTAATTETQSTTAVQPVYTDAPANVEKTETVYVHINNDGSVKDTVVTDWLHTDAACVRVEDVSPLTDIKNVKGTVLPVFENDKLVWNMDSTDLYYTGTTDKAPIVSFDIKYILDGKEISAADIAGKSGKLEIDVTVKNLDARTVNINGTNTVIYNPLVVIGGFVMPYENFTGIGIDNGKLLGDGAKQIPLMIGIPGMKESLNLDAAELEGSGLSLSDTFKITADVTNFELGSMMFAVMPLGSLDLGLTMPTAITDVTNNLSLITDLQGVFEQLNAEGALTALMSNPNSLGELAGVVNKAVNLYKENKALLSVMNKYLTQENIDKLSKLLSDLDDEQLKQALELFSRPEMKYLFENLSTIAADINDLQPVIEAMSADMDDPEVKAAIDNLPQTLNTIAEIKTAIDDNQEILNALQTLMKDENIDAVTAVLNGLSGTLNDEQFKAAYEKLAGSAGDIIARMDAWLDIGEKYSIFTSAPSTFKTSVTFIYETASIKA